MKKKSFIALAAATAVLAGMTSCGNKQENSASQETQPVESTEEVATTEEMTEQPDSVAEEVAAEEAVAVAVAETVASEYTATPSGLKYKVLKKGTGKTPKATDLVTVNYEGKLTNGKIFDSSYQRGEPATFPLNRVIPGWTEGLQLMKEGGVYEFYIPSDLAYGPRGAGADIPPNSDLIFKVELIKVE